MFLSNVINVRFAPKTGKVNTGYLLVIFLTSHLSLFGQIGTGEIVGQIEGYTSHNPRWPTEVQLWNSEHMVATTNTDLEGSFRLKSLKPGLYWINVSSINAGKFLIHQTMLEIESNFRCKLSINEKVEEGTTKCVITYFDIYDPIWRNHRIAPTKKDSIRIMDNLLNHYAIRGTILHATSLDTGLIKPTQTKPNDK